ncbi:hypothetical protein SARC_06472 [Sphaeroforma arctica JP610]|uniref:Phytanoyl-CoA dioxygenase domain-containing protein 1 n=1 Tax=Sphaeroforma arctica JP610 TaxID=667725 RepID=A0A0L0FX27_9EUKA|nr:hypothetical protein SARC_06472 [Sphaeroforma arctica JP610]KNC81189.1 hypothetical protein SARC_06472 [Sphaeroforma arctica JP610]|eukprot:XP_014155091.1 hypothetical protein SARC_06472 [Sphaeroforma arctica JP610]
MMTTELTAEQIRQYHDEGYLVVENFASDEECQALKGRMAELISDWNVEDTSVFTTKEQARTSDDHFMDSANRISFFLEEDAEKNGMLQKDKSHAINKAGHALHIHDPVFKNFVQSGKVSSAVHKMGYKSPSLVQSMYIFKQPKIGGEVTEHQDSSFLTTNPPSCLGLWVALEDATLENGCLWGRPKSHKGGVYSYFTRNTNPNWKEDGETRMVMKPTSTAPDPKTEGDSYVPLMMKAGDAVFLHGAFMHKSYANKSGKARHSFQLHLVEGPSGGAQWSEGNWLQYPPGQSFAQFENYPQDI